MNFLCIFNIVIVLSLILHQDTAGSERFESISTLYYRGAKAAIVCYGKIMSGQSQLRMLNCTDCGLGLNFRSATRLFINGVKQCKILCQPRRRYAVFSSTNRRALSCASCDWFNALCSDWPDSGTCSRSSDTSMTLVWIQVRPWALTGWLTSLFCLWSDLTDSSSFEKAKFYVTEIAKHNEVSIPAMLRSNWIEGKTGHFLLVFPGICLDLSVPTVFVCLSADCLWTDWLTKRLSVCLSECLPICVSNWPTNLLTDRPI